MSESPHEPSVGIDDDQLPEDLQPTDDNPLAKAPGEESEDPENSGEPGAGPSPDLPDMGDPGAGNLG